MANGTNDGPCYGNQPIYVGSRSENYLESLFEWLCSYVFQKNIAFMQKPFKSLCFRVITTLIGTPIPPPHFGLILNTFKKNPWVIEKNGHRICVQHPQIILKHSVRSKWSPIFLLLLYSVISGRCKHYPTNKISVKMDSDMYLQPPCFVDLV